MVHTTLATIFIDDHNCCDILLKLSTECFYNRGFSNYDVNMPAKASQLRLVQPLHQPSYNKHPDDKGLYPQHLAQISDNTAIKMSVAPLWIARMLGIAIYDIASFPHVYSVELI
jgi:hypothetical protein